MWGNGNPNSLLVGVYINTIPEGSGVLLCLKMRICYDLAVLKGAVNKAVHGIQPSVWQSHFTKDNTTRCLT